MLDAGRRMDQDEQFGVHYLRHSVPHRQIRNVTRLYKIGMWVEENTKPDTVPTAGQSSSGDDSRPRSCLLTSRLVNSKQAGEHASKS